MSVASPESILPNIHGCIHFASHLPDLAYSVLIVQSSKFDVLRSKHIGLDCHRQFRMNNCSIVVVIFKVCSHDPSIKCVPEADMLTSII